MKSWVSKQRISYQHAFGLVFFSTLAAGWCLTGFLGRVAERDFKTGVDRETQLIASFLVDFLNGPENASKALSQSKSVADALSIGSAANLKRVNKLLDFHRETMEMSLSYLMDAQGRVVASSDRHDKNSLLGKSFASRPYLKGAMAGRLTRYFALGKITHESGYFVAAPVAGRNNTVAGVVVNKRNISLIEDAVKKNSDTYLVSPEGIIFLSSRKEHLYRALWPVDESRRPELVASGQFGDITFAPLLVSEPRPETYVRFESRQLYLQRLPIGREGWTLVSMKDARIVATYRWFGILITVVFVLLFVGSFNILLHENRSLQAARDLLKAKDDWERTFDAVPDLIMIVDDNDRIQCMNRSMANRLGISKQEANGRYCYELLHCHEEPPHTCPHRLLLDSGQVSAGSWFDKTLNGHFLVTASPIYALDGTVVATVQVMHDVSDLKMIEQSLRESAQRLELALEGSHDATWEWDMIADRAILNSRYYEMTEYAPEEVETNFAFFTSTIHPDDVAEVGEKVTEYLAGKTDMYRSRCRMVTRSGRVRHVLWRGKVVRRDESGRPLKMAGVVTDITEQKMSDDELIRRHNLESIGLLAGGLSHDFNNVLNIILGNISFAKMVAGGDSSLAEPLTDAEEACERAKEFGIRLQEFSQGSSPAKEPLAFQSLIEDAVRLLLEGSNIAHSIHSADDIPPVEADPRQIRLVFENLLTNAKEAMSDGGTVNIGIDSLAVDGNQGLPLASGLYVRISLQDDGRGIPDEDLPKVLDPYFSTKDTYSQKGMGLGLSICHTILKRHRGHIILESRLGIGTRVTVYLPALLEEEGSAMGGGH